MCLASLLSTWEVCSDYVTDGARALVQLQTATHEACPYDVVLLDSQMPGMDGITLAQAIHAHPTLAPLALVLLTPRGQCAPHLEALHAVFAGSLTKPVRPTLLYDCLRAIRACTGADQALPYQAL